MAPPPSQPRRARETLTHSQGHREQTQQLHAPDEPPSHLHTSNVPKVRVPCPSAVSGGTQRIEAGSKVFLHLPI